MIRGPSNEDLKRVTVGVDATWDDDMALIIAWIGVFVLVFFFEDWAEVDDEALFV